MLRRQVLFPIFPQLITGYLTKFAKSKFVCEKKRNHQFTGAAIEFPVFAVALFVPSATVFFIEFIELNMFNIY